MKHNKIAIGRRYIVAISKFWTDNFNRVRPWEILYWRWDIPSRSKLKIRRQTDRHSLKENSKERKKSGVADFMTTRHLVQQRVTNIRFYCVTKCHSFRVHVRAFRILNEIT